MSLPSALDADEAVLDNVDSAHAVLAAQLVEVQEDLQRVGDLGLVVVVGDLGGDALLEVDGLSLVGLASWLTICSGVLGASSGSTVNFHMSLGGVTLGSSRIPAS